MKTNIASYFLPGVVALGVLGSFTARAAGPASELYLTSGNSLMGIQGTSVLFNVAQSPSGQSQRPLAINSTVRTIGFSSGRTGGEYSLSGTPTGATYAFPAALGSDTVHDGTTDGSFNYAWDFTSGAAYRFNLDWTGGTVLFTLGNGNTNGNDTRMGIAYDPSNNSLWVSGFGGTVGTLISDYSLAGTLLSSFKIGHTQSAALALDPADGTLWLNNTAASNLTLEQYARSIAGSFGATETALNTQVYAGLFAATFGGEFQHTVVPEPATWTVAMLVSLVLLLGFRRFSRRSTRPDFGQS